MHKMGQVCAPHPCHNPSRNPRMRHRQKPFPQPAHHLRQRKQDTGGKRVVGDITQKRKKNDTGWNHMAGIHDPEEMIKHCERASRLVLSHALPTDKTHACTAGTLVTSNRTHGFSAATTLAWRPSKNKRGGSNNVVRASGAFEPDKPHSATNVLLCYTCLYPRTAASRPTRVSSGEQAQEKASHYCSLLPSPSACTVVASRSVSSTPPTYI